MSCIIILKVLDLRYGGLDVGNDGQSSTHTGEKPARYGNLNG
jgi:hypothetical protein